MEQRVTAVLKNIRIAPRKTRLLADVIRGLPVTEAEAQLMLSSRRVGVSLLKLLRSAIANAKNSYHLSPEKLFVKEVRVDQGQKIKRWTPRARGAVNLIEKKMSHVSLVLGVSDASHLAPYAIPERIKKVKEKKHVQSAEEKKKGHEKEGGDSHSEHAVKEVPKQANQPGVFKRMFRRKSI